MFGRSIRSRKSTSNLQPSAKRNRPAKAKLSVEQLEPRVLLSTSRALLLSLVHESLDQSSPPEETVPLEEPTNELSSDPNIRVDEFFGDHMVLQQGVPITITGTAGGPGIVEASILNQTVNAQVAPNLRWTLEFKPLAAGGPYTLRIQGDNIVTLRDIMVGEVWLCSGQSNMFMSLRRTELTEHANIDKNQPNLRLLTVAKPEDRDSAFAIAHHWSRSTESRANRFSAICYHYGLQLMTELNVPVGLINASYGGSPAEAWVPIAAIKQDAKLSLMVQRYERTLRNENPLPVRKIPGALFSKMIRPLISYTIKGVAWYQGESNVRFAADYDYVLEKLILSWRGRWGQGPFPFLVIQLTSYNGNTNLPESWAELRESQKDVASRGQNVELVVTTDLGDPDDIHPKTKAEVGRRLYLVASAKVYGKDVPHLGPRLVSARRTRAGDRLILDFEFDQGLMGKEGRLRGFLLAGEDRTFHRAVAIIRKDNKVVVKSDLVAIPTAVRYNWKNNTDGNLYDLNGLPAGPFRSDLWPLRYHY